jgi:membrane associated rhomboid family serine protease
VFLAVPTSAGLGLCRLPFATAVLVLMLVAVAVLWTLPAHDELREERRRAESALGEPGAVRPEEHEPGRAALQAVRRAALAARVAELAAADPVERWGYGPGSPRWAAVTAFFVHGDWVHLAGNLIGLVLAGILVETAIGPASTLFLALTGGAIALLVDAGSAPGLLVGASSGVAVLFGAASFIYRRTRVRFAYLYFQYLRPTRGTFQIPALVLPVVWVTQQAIGLFLAARGRADSVAYGSHLVGFAIGLLAAALLPGGMLQARSFRQSWAWRR